MNQSSKSLEHTGLNMAHEIIMLGTGNAFLPNGRLHSFAIFDKKHIIDAPPTALISLRQMGMKISDIRTIFITHLHGDHIFGIPFLLLERTYISDRELIQPLTIVAAPGARKRIEELCEIAYPGSLERILNTVFWNENVNGVTRMDGIGIVSRSITAMPLIHLDTVSNPMKERNSCTAETRVHVRLYTMR